MKLFPSPDQDLTEDSRLCNNLLHFHPHWSHLFLSSSTQPSFLSFVLYWLIVHSKCGHVDLCVAFTPLHTWNQFSWYWIDSKIASDVSTLLFDRWPIDDSLQHPKTENFSGIILVWTFSSGRCLEDIFYIFATKYIHTSIFHRSVVLKDVFKIAFIKKKK